jgi:hypothetical protein
MEENEMNDFSEFHNVIRDRLSSSGAYYYADLWWDREVQVFIKNMDSSIAFILQDCTDEELFWLGEVYDDIAEKTHSEAFIHALRERVKRVENETWKNEILEDIRTAAAYIEKPRHTAQ